jgi:hypothetical protein
MKMQQKVYCKDTAVEDMVFPDVAKRGIYHGTRTQSLIPGYREICDRNTGRVYAIVKEGYQLLPHEDVIAKMDELCTQFPEYGKPTREIWMNNYGGRMHTRWTFTDVDFKIGTLATDEPDIVHPTMETFCSYDTSLAQRTLVGGFRLVCSNGMVVGKILGEYKRKHTASLDMERAKRVLAQGMENYSEAQKLWLSYADRNAVLSEINCYEELPYNKDEKLAIEASIKDQGNVIQWDDYEIDNRKVEINAWDLMQIHTAEISHKVTDVARQTKLNDRIAKVFAATK